MQDDFTDALKKALNKLQASERFESEVRACLTVYETDVVEEVLTYLEKHRLLSDERAAEQTLRNRSGSKTVGRERLVGELEKRGAPSDIIDSILPDAETERERLRALLQSKFQPTADRGKAGRFLFSRGFSEDDIGSELDAYLKDAD